MIKRWKTNFQKCEIRFQVLIIKNCVKIIHQSISNYPCVLKYCLSILKKRKKALSIIITYQKPMNHPIIHLHLNFSWRFRVINFKIKSATYLDIFALLFKVKALVIIKYKFVCCKLVLEHLKKLFVITLWHKSKWVL